MTAERPPVVVLTGAPGSGKSTTARELAGRLGAAVLDQDAMTNPLVDVVAGLVGAQDYDDARLSGLVRDARYACLLRVAADCVSTGLPVVLVAPFTAERRDAAAWARLVQEVEGFGGQARLVWLRVTPEVLAGRLAARGSSRDVAKLRDLAQFLAAVDLGAPAAPHLPVDAALPATRQADVILTGLSRRDG